MASKLCCTAEQEGRSDSPDLPNVRISDATPAAKPLLPKEEPAPNSRFTSAQSDELHELQQIFENVHQDTLDRSSPPRLPRQRSSRPSVVSLHSLHKMTSMRSIIRRKFSKDLSRKVAGSPDKPRGKNAAVEVESDTIVKHDKADHLEHLKITKENLRRDLLSDKKPHEGGYDSDAEVLDDIARNIGKKTPGKRPSVHKIDWTPSSGSKPSLASSPEAPNIAELTRDMQPYQIQRPQNVSFKSRIAQVFSTPNLRADNICERDHKLRRSYSATSMQLPKPSPISPLRLPSLTTNDKDGRPWAEVMNQSLRLSQFPIPPRHPSPESSKTVSGIAKNTNISATDTDIKGSIAAGTLPDAENMSSSARPIEIRIQQPTSTATPRTSTSVRATARENAPPVKEGHTTEVKLDDEEDSTRQSVHLYSMRISHHLRSGSLLSWDQLAETSDFPSPPRRLRERSAPDQSQFTRMQQQMSRHERQTSSSGFGSSKVPSKWGRVIVNDPECRTDVASSIYSSRPQSPPDSFGESKVNLSRMGTRHRGFNHSSIDLRSLRRSNSFPTDNEDTPRPKKIYGSLERDMSTPRAVDDSLLGVPHRVIRKNSVAETKKSKFREEFSPSPPRKKLTPSASIIRFFNPKRLSLRSQSDASLRTSAQDGAADDAPSDVFAAERERRQSRSIVSLRAEQDAFERHEGTKNLWSQALKTHQEEKAAMLRPHNKALAIRGSPFRERSASCASPRPSVQEDVDPFTQNAAPKRLSVPLLESHTPTTPSTTERSVLPIPQARYQEDSGQDITKIFEKQTQDEETGGAWGRYPSHNREERVTSISKFDRVDTRDFALEAAIEFASGTENGHDDDMVDPKGLWPSSPLSNVHKKRKKRIGNGRMAKSSSMTFGRKLIKNYYAGIFKSSSSEFRQHGRGHRSSIASGGNLDYPELELLPAVFMSRNTDGAADQKLRRDRDLMRCHSERHSDGNEKNKSPVVDSSMSGLRPRRNSSAPNLNDLRKVYDVGEHRVPQNDRARMWSTYYENCVPGFPRLSTETGPGLDEFQWPRQHSQESRRNSMCMPPRSAIHSRNISQLSRLSNMSRGSARPSHVSTGENGGGETKSFVSVRHSTMDLISKFKQQEFTEHERVMSLTRAESRGGGVSVVS